MLCNNRGYSIENAAKDLGMNKVLLERYLRIGGHLFGFYVPPMDGNKRGAYYVYRERVEAYIQARDIKFACPYAQKMEVNNDGE